MDHQEIKYSKAQIRAYLRRIHWRGTEAVSLQNLTAMQRQHLFCIPYENLDLLNGVPVSLTPEALFQKIVLDHRGGSPLSLRKVWSRATASAVIDMKRIPFTAGC